MTHLSEAILHNTTGAILTLHDSFVCRLIKEHADFLVYDAAARPVSVDVLKNLIAAAGDTPFLVRVEDTQAATVQRYLNLGVDGLIFPDIRFAVEAEKVIAACLYPPEGARPARAFDLDENVSLQTLNDQITLIVEIAHPQAVAQIDEIAEVVGVDGILIAPTRLAVAMEKSGDQAELLNDTDVLNAIHSVIRSARSFEVPVGIEQTTRQIDHAPIWEDTQFTLPIHDATLLRSIIDRVVVQPSAQDEEEVFEDMPFSSLVAVRE